MILLLIFIHRDEYEVEVTAYWKKNLRIDALFKMNWWDGPVIGLCYNKQVRINSTYN